MASSFRRPVETEARRQQPHVGRPHVIGNRQRRIRRRYLRTRGVQRHTRLQFGVNIYRLFAVGCVENERPEKIDFTIEDAEDFEARWQDADHRTRCSINVDRLADDGRIGRELTTPEAVA